MQTIRRGQARAFTIVEILVAVGVLAVTTIAMTQAMLVLNRNSAVARVKNLAKALVLSRIQEVAAVTYDYNATPQVIPTLLNVGVTTENVNIGDASTGLGNVPGTLTWTVASVGAIGIRSVKCRVAYTYMGRPQSYEQLTYRSPD
ncbi:MAG TPA: hypothetical protein VGO11_20545 [Chthoniobacteraceae bacterium]|jgi:type II secretory pathway pseudopilin PulG|nr:hypothetical protein [Chthoniobacteraceae bacterium]